jgi:hypothetical protein
MKLRKADEKTCENLIIPGYVSSLGIPSFIPLYLMARSSIDT